MSSPPEFSFAEPLDNGDSAAEIAPEAEFGAPLGASLDASALTVSEAAFVAAQVPDAPAIDAAISGAAISGASISPEIPPGVETPGQKNSEINRKAKRGIKMMMGRQAILQILTFGGGILLARLLDPATFGVYSIITFLVSVSGMLANFGLAPSLVQRRGEIGERDLRVAFTLQQALITLIFGLLWLLAPALVRFYPQAPPQAIWLLRAMAVSLYLTSWRTLSKLQLERALSFDKIARVEVVETALYQGLAVVLAVAGCGIWSFIVAALARGLCGTLLSYYYAPWPVRFAWDREIARELLRFGLPFQAETFTQSVGGWITPIVVGRYFGGPAAIGYLTFASSNGRKPLLLADSFITVSFPHFSRLQDDLPEIERILVRYLTYLLLAAGLWSAALIVCGGSLVELIYGAKWRPSESALAIFSVAMAADIVLRLVSVATTARGHVKQVWSRTATRTAAQLLFAIPALHFMGFNGVPIAYFFALTTTMPFLFTLLGKGALKRVLWPLNWILLPWISAITIGTIGMHFATSQESLSESHWHRALDTGLGLIAVCLTYAVSAYFFSPHWLKQNLLQQQKKSLTADKIN